MKKLLQMALFISVFIVILLFPLFERTYADTFCVANFDCNDGNSATCDWCEKTAIGGICINRNCNDDIDCTTDYCAINGCLNTPYDSSCEDGDVCTIDKCYPELGGCYHVSAPDLAPCDDGLFCNGTDKCDRGMCRSHAGNPCPAGTFCNEVTDSCDSTPPVTSTTTTRKSTSTTTSVIGSTTSTTPPIITTTVQPLPGTYSISGYITGELVEGISILLSGTSSESSTTDENGYYEFIELASGYYNITPKMDGYSFSPPYHVIQNLTNNLYNMDFVSTKIPCVIEFICGEDAYEAEFLRDYRDSVLAQTPEGQELIKLYYQWSPTIVEMMNAVEEFKEQVKEMIDGVVTLIGEEE